MESKLKYKIIDWLVKVLRIRMYDTYNQAKHAFKRPKLYWKFGLWRKDPCLPVWRRGPIIKLIKYRYTDVKWDTIGKSKPKKYKIGGKWVWSSPIDIKGWAWSDEYKKQHPIISKIFKPQYQLPIWCGFYIFNHDLFWKTKWDDYRYEFPPQFTIVAFGLSLSFWLKHPLGKKYRDDTYWEAMLWYIDKKYIKDAFKECPVWKNYDTNELTFSLCPEILNPPYDSMAQVMIDDYIKNKKDNIDEDSSIW